MRYAVVTPDRLVVNVILWDGVAPYDPGPDVELVALPDGSRVEIGDVLPG